MKRALRSYRLELVVFVEPEDRTGFPDQNIVGRRIEDVLTGLPVRVASYGQDGARIESARVLGPVVEEVV